MAIGSVQEQISVLEDKERQLLNSDSINIDELNIVRNKLSELQLELTIQKQAEQAKQERVDAAVQESTQVVDEMLVGENLTLRQVISDEFSYQLVSIAMKSKLQAQATNYINEIDEILRASAEREANLEFQIKQKDAKLDQFETQISELEKQVNTLTFERDEAFKVRDNAAAEIEEYKSEAEKQKKLADEKQKQLEESRKGNGQVDFPEEQRKAQEAWIASRIKVTEMYEDKEDLKRATWKVRLLGDYEGVGKDGELISINYLEKGKYLEVSQEEAARFRAEQYNQQLIEQSQSSIEIPTAHSPLVSDEVSRLPEDFRPGTNSNCENEANVSWSGDTSDHSGVAVQTLEEAFQRIEALEKVVFVVGRPLAG